MATEDAGVGLHETVVLDKFEGDDQEQPALATIVTVDGVIQSLCTHAWVDLPDAPPFESDKVCPKCGKEWSDGAN